jgi:hypothetical protein
MTRTAAYLLAFAATISLGACETMPKPDYTIRVVPSADGKTMVAMPPDCPSWSDNPATTLDNQTLPQYGCANARNLATMVDQPSDLIKGRPLDPARGVISGGTIVRYDNNQTRGLIYPSQTPDTAVDTTSNPTATSGLTGESASSGGGTGK